MKLAIGAGKGGGISGLTIGRSAVTVAFRRIGLGDTGFRATAWVAGFAGRFVATALAAARFAAVFSWALGPR